MIFYEYFFILFYFILFYRKRKYRNLNADLQKRFLIKQGQAISSEEYGK